MQYLCVRTPSDVPTNVPVLGIEIPGNRKDLISLCSLGNIDPQHGGSKASNRCAAEEAMEYKGMLSSDMVLVCTRIDLDAVVAMAIIQLSEEDQRVEKNIRWPSHKLLATIGKADSFFAGTWPGQRRIPSPDNPWFEHGTPEDIEILAGADWWCKQAAKGAITLAEAVTIIKDWITGYASLPIPDEVWTSRLESLERVDHLQLCLDHRVVYHDAVTHGPVSPSLAYCKAPVSVVRTESPILQPDGSTILVKRYTIASFDSNRFDFDRLVAELNALENQTKTPGLDWGGNVQTGRIVGSPQGCDSKLTPEQVLECLGNCLTK